MPLDHTTLSIGGNMHLASKGALGRPGAVQPWLLPLAHAKRTPFCQASRSMQALTMHAWPKPAIQKKALDTQCGPD